MPKSVAPTPETLGPHRMAPRATATFRIQITGDTVRLRWDYVIADMLTGLGAEVVRLRAGFTPEAGAYAHHDH